MSQPTPPSRWVLITGASTGIGAAACRDLGRAGFAIIATARHLDAAENSAQLARAAGVPAVSLSLDVTNPAHLERLAPHVADITGSAGLYGLINNAGIALSGPCETLTDADWRRQFDVNVFGLIATTRALLPQLRAARGRIINLSSVSGLNAFPFLAPYAASKFAVEAYSDALRVELQLTQTGVHVSLIEPGPIQTPIWKKDSRPNADTSVAHAAYTPALNAFAKLLEKSATRAAPTEHVTRALVHALTARRPRARYLVAADFGTRLLCLLPTRWRDALIRQAMK